MKMSLPRPLFESDKGQWSQKGLNNVRTCAGVKMQKQLETYIYVRTLLKIVKFTPCILYIYLLFDLKIKIY